MMGSLIVVRECCWMDFDVINGYVCYWRTNLLLLITILLRSVIM